MSEFLPNKKQRRSSSNKESKISSGHFTLEDNLETIQKQAILRQLYEFKREAIKYEAEAKAKVEENEIREEQIGIALSEIQLIYDLVESLFDELGCTRETRCFDPLDLLRDLLENKIDSADFKRQLSEQRSSTLALFSDLRSTLLTIFETSSYIFSKLDVKDISTEIHDLIKKQMIQLKDFKELSTLEHQPSSIEQLKEKVVYLESSLRTEKASLLSKESEIEALNERLNSALKNVDRLQMAQRNRPKGSTPSEELSLSELTTDPKLTEELKNTYLKEIKELQEEKAQLLVEMGFLKTELRNPSVDHIRNSAIYKDALIQADHFEHEYQEQLKTNGVLRGEVEALKTERTEVWERISNDESVRWNTLSNQLKSSMADLARVRKQRDAVASELKLARIKDNAKHHEKQELRKAMSNQESLIKCYRSELSRLRMKLAYLNNDLEAVKFIEAHPEIATMDDCFKKLADAESQIKCQEAELAQVRDSVRGNGRCVNNGTQDALQTLTEQLEACREQLRMAERFLGADPDETRARIKSLEEQCALYSKSEAQLAQEIDQLGKAYSELTESQVNRVVDLGRKEDQITHLSCEKAKLERRVSALTKDNEQSINLIDALKKQTTKLQDHIRKLEEQIKNLSFQLKTMERDFNSCCDIRSRIEEQLKVACRATQESKAQNNLLATKLAEVILFFDLPRKYQRPTYALDGCPYVRVELVDKTRRLEEDRFSHLQQRDELAVLQSRLDSLIESKKQAPHDRDLSVTLKHAKQLLQCTSCSLRFKSHALIKCMHVFCKQCIEDRLETRQRKCPSCNESFGANDVKQIYL
ncbi:E3 ubiquitin-protein ligase bre1 [Massospora cicadina]|nr:E3 ubiquitin-protein ligase bre1 [Massospora cicadina]